ncbi:MAG: hypothetical protein ACI8ZB_005171 [Desulforhopalus sp.]|jgi:hypothetical protein
MFKTIASIIALIGGSHFIYKTLRERYSDMRKYLEPEVCKEGFEVHSIVLHLLIILSPLRMKTLMPPPHLLDWDQS